MGLSQQGFVSGYPFSVDRSLPESLTDQIVGGVTAAIETGAYANGARLPSLRELSDVLGVSEIIVRRAYNRLVSNGEIVPRHGIGYVVSAEGSAVFRGRVLLVGFGTGENYLTSSGLDVLERRFAERHYLVTRVTVRRDTKLGKPDPILDHALRQSYSLIVSLYDGLSTIARLERTSSPVVCLYNRNRPSGTNVTPVRFCEDAALTEFAADCRRRNVRRVLQVLFHPAFANAGAVLSDAGIAVEEMRIRSRYGNETIGSLQQRTLKLFELKLSRGREWLPDIIYFNDDYVATSAVLSLLKHGVRIPEDVSIASWSNAGHGPELPVPLARILFDGYAAGETLFEIARNVLSGSKPATDSIMTKFVAADAM